MIPEWYKNNFHDIESALVDLFQKVFPSIKCVSWIPDDWFEKGGDTDPLLRFMRIPPGYVHWETRREECSVQVAAAIPPDYDAYVPNRDRAWQVINVVRACLLPMDGFPIAYETSDGDREVFIHGVEESVGPQVLPELGVPDARVVPVTFKICSDVHMVDIDYDYLSILRDL